ncbi:MAG: hypothetical protein WDN49_11090 [Acetobacteraceae bacterium]
MNTAGVIPPIFASSLLLIPATIAGFGNTNPGFVARLARGATRAWPAALPSPSTRG